MKLNKMILGIETHAYSPEQNALHFINGSKIRTPNVTSIHTARKKLFPKAENNRFAKIEVTYPKELNLDYLDKKYRGGFKDSKSLLSFIKKLKEKHSIDTDQLFSRPDGFSGIINAEIKVYFPRISKISS